MKKIGKKVKKLNKISSKHTKKIDKKELIDRLKSLGYW